MNCTEGRVHMGDVFQETNRYIYYIIGRHSKGFVILYQNRAGRWVYNSSWRQPMGYTAHIIGSGHASHA